MDIFGKSENFKSEYSCAVVKIGELIPIEGSDFLAKTLVAGTQIVVRKDMVSEGEIMIYAANETQLNERFLSVNNLFEIGCRKMNSNCEEVEAIMKPYLDVKPKIDKMRDDAKILKGMIEKLSGKLSKHKKKIKRLEKALSGIRNEADKQTKKVEVENSKLKIEAYEKRIETLTKEYDELKRSVADMVKSGEPYVEEAKKLCGFFNNKCRVRCIKLKGEPSFGFLASVEAIQRFDSSVTSADVEKYLDQEFDTVNGELFVKAYIPPVKFRPERIKRTGKARKQLKLFDRIIDGTFRHHYDTGQLNKEISRIKPDDNVVITNKIHGTSCIVAKVDVRVPKKIALYKRLINRICEAFKKPKPFIDYNIEKGPVYSSRTVIRNKTVNPNVKDEYHDVDIWSEWGERIYPYLEDGMTVYGEIFGYMTGTDKYIQKNYDYGCERGENIFMPYRITSVLEDGNRREWEISEVREWTENLQQKIRQADSVLADRIFPIQILYTGSLGDLYPEVETDENWSTEVLRSLKSDKQHFNMEGVEPLCRNVVPAEGIVLRIINDPINEAFKLKCINFTMKEALMYDSDDYVDIEVSEGNY